MQVERADAARNRQTILDAADELFALADAPASVSMDDIARVAGVGKGTLFRRFGDRTNLIRQVYTARISPLRAQIESGPPPLGPATRRSNASPPSSTPSLGSSSRTFISWPHSKEVPPEHRGHSSIRRLQRRAPAAFGLDQSAQEDDARPMDRACPSRLCARRLAPTSRRGRGNDPQADPIAAAGVRSKHGLKLQLMPGWALPTGRIGYQWVAQIGPQSARLGRPGRVP